MSARRLLCLWAVAVAVAVAAQPAMAHAQAPPGPPGPPPGSGADLPAPPGTAPAVVPPGTPAAVPATPSGPGLLDGAGTAFDRANRTISLALACQADGTLSVRAPTVGRGTLARSRYRCALGRTTARLRVAPTAARRLRRVAAARATVTVRQAGRAFRLSLVVRVGGAARPATGFWTDGHLQCTDPTGAPAAYLVEPDFTAATPTTISTRGWVAWYTSSGGWHWLGVGGENANPWQTWTATVRGVAQFHPGGAPAPVPWTWGPVSVPVGQGISTVGVYEIVYWVAGHPDYQWQYVNAGTAGAAAAGGGRLYCSY